MNKILKIFLLMGIVVMSLSFAAACDDTDSTAAEEITVNFIEESFIPDVYMNEEFDIMETIDEANEDYSYELTECFYLDNQLSRVDIPFEGTSFTPTTAFDVYFTLKVSNGHGQSKEFEMQLPITIPMDEVQQRWINGWADTGVSKKMTAMPEHLAEGKKSAVKVTYSGTWNPPAYNGVAIGSFADKNARTTWDNAVVYLKVKNISPFGLTLGMGWAKNSEPYYFPKNGIAQLTYSTSPQFQLPVGEWVEAAISLRKLGINYNLFDDKANFGMKIRITDDTALQPPYSWGLVIAESEIVDYDSERFPDLDTTIPCTVPPNEMERAWLDCWHSDGVDAEYTENPDHLIDGVSSAVRFIYNGVWNGWNPSYAGLAIGQFGQNGINTTWENAVIYLKVKNLSVQPIQIGMNITKGTKTAAMSFSGLPKTIVPVDTVSEVVISLKHLGITYNLFDDGSVFYFAINLPDLPDIPDPTDVKYTWDMVVLDAAVIDYDSERFPDLDTSLPPNEIEQAWLNCWHSGGVEAELTKNPEHLIDGVSSAVRFIYNGVWNGWNPPDAGLAIGEFGQNGINTTWENAVIYLKVKNLSVQPIQIGMNITEGTKTKAMYFSELPKTIIPVDTVSEVVISLKHLGITYNLFDDGAQFYFIINLPDLPDVPDPTDVKYTWDMVVLDSAVIDYDGERFPDLDTSLPPDEIEQAWLNCWHSDGVEAQLTENPEHLIDGVSSAVRFVYNGLWNGWNPPDAGLAIGEFGQNGINTTWENAVICLKVKNLSVQPIQIGMNITKGTKTKAMSFPELPKTIVPVDTVSEIVISLKHLGITYNLFDDGSQFYFAVNLPDLPDVPDPTDVKYTWDMVVLDAAVVDYDSERFPDLDTSLPDETT